MIAAPQGPAGEKKRLEGAGKVGGTARWERERKGVEKGGRREDEEEIGKEGKWGGTEGVTTDWKR